MTTTTRHDTTSAAPASPDWELALCAQTDPAVFFPEGRGQQINQQLVQAKQTCNQCPIRSACLEWALDTSQSAGVWGGLDEKERRVLLRQRTAGVSSYMRCIEEQEYIEQRIREGASHREIGGELGVCHSAVGRAWRFFQSERELVEGEQVKAA